MGGTSCTREPRVSPCGKHRMEPARGATPRASRQPGVAAGVKKVVCPPVKVSFRYSRNVRRDQRSPYASYLERGSV